mgnify:CR=1 FL=1
MNAKLTKKQKYKKMIDTARELAPTCSDWMSFHNQLFGVGGLFGKLFTEIPERVEFMESPEHEEIKQLKQELQNQKEVRFNLRIPKQVDDQLQAEMKALGIKSKNELCIMKLAAPAEAVV